MSYIKKYQCIMLRMRRRANIYKSIKYTVLTHNRTKVGVIHELPVGKNKVLSLILRKS